MAEGPEDEARGWFSGRPSPLQWSVLLVLSLVIAAVLEWIGIPAALLMGPMAAAILLGTNGATVRVPRRPYIGAQALVGCLIARAIDPQIVCDLPRRLAALRLGGAGGAGCKQHARLAAQPLEPFRARRRSGAPRRVGRRR